MPAALEILLSPFRIFVEWPALACLPAVACMALAPWAGRRTSAAGTWMWAAYAAYEFAMSRRWLCSGECDIRVDLPVIYPALALISLIVVLRSALRWWRERYPVPPEPERP